MPPSTRPALRLTVAPTPVSVLAIEPPPARLRHMAKDKSRKKDKRRKKGKPPKASRVDRYDLYQQSVQVPSYEVKFFDRVYKAEYGRPAALLREDFCGTFAICCNWVRKRPERQALGVDLDPEPLRWGREHNLAKLHEEDRGRVTLLQDDVRAVEGPKADIVAAENFSWWIFKTRAELREYFEAARANLKPKGVFVLDSMGGSEVIEEDHEDVTKYDGFKYVWEQARFDPITHHCQFHIHFKFKDGSALRKAFTYDWRLWTLPETTEVLAEAGFSRADVYWEGTDPETGEGNEVYRKREHAPSESVWISYIVGVK
jgi:hypothetical protein